MYYIQNLYCSKNTIFSHRMNKKNPRVIIWQIFNIAIYSMYRAMGAI